MNGSRRLVMEYKFNIVYKTTNHINEKIYIGVHSTDDLDDDYKGSGYALKNAFRKHGRENFTREVLSHWPDRAGALAEEARLVTRDFALREDNYNMQGGGGHGMHSDRTKEQMSESSKLTPKILCPHCDKMFDPGNYAQSHGDKCRKKTGVSAQSAETRAKKGAYHAGVPKSAEQRAKIGAGNKGKTQTADARRKISETRKNIPKVICEHCGKTMDTSNYKQHHGDNCNHKLIQEITTRLKNRKPHETIARIAIELDISVHIIYNHIKNTKKAPNGGL